MRAVRVSREARATTGISNECTATGARKVSAAKKLKKELGDRVVGQVLGLKPEMLKNARAMTALSGKITELILAELKEATSRPVSAADQIDECSSGFEGEDAWVNGFSRSISTVLVHLTHQAFLNKITWADTGEGKEKVSEVLAVILSDILSLPSPSAQKNTENVDGALNDSIAAVLQAGSKLVNEKLENSVKSESLKKIINNVLFSMMAEGIELTENNVDELLSGVWAIIINTLMSIRSDTVRLFSERNRQNPDEIHVLRDRMVSSVAELIKQFVKDHGNWAAKGVFRLADWIAPEKFTEGVIKKEINKKLDEYLGFFQNEALFEKEITKIIKEKEKTLKPIIIRNLEKLKQEINDGKANKKNIQDDCQTLVNQITAHYRKNNQQPAGQKTSPEAVASLRDSNDISSTAPAVTSDQSTSSTHLNASGLTTEPRTKQMRVIDQVIAQESSKMADEAIGLLIGELRKHLDTVIHKVEPGIGKVLGTAVSKGAAFITGQNKEEHSVNQEPAETTPGLTPEFTAAISPVLTKLVVDIFIGKLESTEWERTTRTKIREAVVNLSTPADPQGTLQSANCFDEPLKSAQADLLRQMAGPLQSALNKLPSPALQQLSSDFILHSTRDGTVWLDELVTDLFNEKIDDESIVLTITDTVSEEVVKLQHLLVSSAINWLKQRTKEWATTSQVTQGVDWLARWITDNKQQIDLDAKAYVKALLVQMIPDLEAAIHQRLKTLRAAVENSQQDNTDVVTTLAGVVDELNKTPKGSPGQTDAVADSKKQTPEHWHQLCRAVVEQLGDGTGEVMDLMVNDADDLVEQKSPELAAGRFLLTRHIGAVMGEVIKEGAGFIAQRNAAQRSAAQRSAAQRSAPPHNGNDQSVAGLAQLTDHVPSFLTTTVVNNLSETLLSTAWKEQMVGKVKKSVRQVLLPNDNNTVSADAPTEGQTSEPPAVKLSVAGSAADKLLRKELADMLRTGASQLAAVLKTQPYETVKGMARELPLKGMADGIEWLNVLITDLFNDDEDATLARITEALTEQAVAAQTEAIDEVLGWLDSEAENPDAGGTTQKTNRETLLKILVSRLDNLLEPAVAGASAELFQRTQPAAGLTEVEQLRNAIQPFLRGQLDQSQVIKRLAAYGVDQLTAWVRAHREDIRQDVATQVRALMKAATKDLETILKEHLATLRTAVANGQQHRVDADKILARAAKRLHPESDDDSGLIGLAALDAMAEWSEDHEEPQTPEHWRELCQAIAEQLGNGVDDAIELTKQESRDLVATRSLLTAHIGAVMGSVVEASAEFIVQRNAVQRSAPQYNGNDQSAEGLARLTGYVPSFLTTNVVNNLSEILLSAAWKAQAVGKVKQSVSQALLPNDKGVVAVDEPIEGQSAEPPALKHSVVGSAADSLLRKELAGMLRTGADQLAALLKAQPYETLKGMARELPLKGMADGIEWLDVLVTDLFNEDEDATLARVTRVLTEQAVAAQMAAIDAVLGWLDAEAHDPDTEEKAQKTNREKLLRLLASQMENLVEPVVAGASVELVQRTQPAAGLTEAKALRNAIQPFLRGQLDQSRVIDQLATYSVDQLTAWVRAHREDIRQDVETLVRSLMKAATKDLETILKEHLATLRAAVTKARQDKADAVTTLQLAAEQLEPEETPGDAAIKDVKKTTANSKKHQDHWRGARKAVASQLGNLAGDAIRLTIDETKQLEVARSILSDGFGKVMEVAVKEGAEFVARYNDSQNDAQNDAQNGCTQSHAVVLPGEAISQLTGVVSPFLTTTVVENISNKLLSDAWQKQTVGEVKKAAEKVMAPVNQGKENVVTSAGNQQAVQPVAADQRTAIAREADEMLKQGLARMLGTGADQLEAVLQGLPYDSVKEMVSDLTRQGIADGTRWLDVLATGLFCENEVVVPRVIDAITQQAVVTLQAVVDGVFDWLGSEDKETKQQPNRQKLLDILVHRMNTLVEPVVTDSSRQIVQSVTPGSESRALRDAVLPFLQDQLNRGQVLERLAGYSVDQLSDWIRQNREVIKEDMAVNVRAMMQKAAPELELILHNRLALLRSALKQSPQNKGDVVTTLRRAAEEIAPPPVINTTIKKSRNVNQPEATGMWSSLIPGLSKGIAEVIRQGTDIIRRKVWADNLRSKLGRDEDHARMSIFPVVIPHVQRMVKEAVSAGAGYAIHQFKGRSDGNMAGMTEAVTIHLQALTADYLGHMVADAIEGMANAVNKNAGDIQNAIEQALNNSGPPMDVATLLTPHINGAIDQALHQSKQIILERTAKWIEASSSTATPELHKAIDKILTHIMAKGGEWIIGHQKGIEIAVIEPIQKELTETLKRAQADIIENVALWLGNEANVNSIVATFTGQIRVAVTQVVVATVAKQISGKDSGSEFARAVDNITPYITPIVDQALTQAITYTVKWLSGWVRDHGADISSLLNPLIDKKVQEVMPSVRQAVQDKALLQARNKAQAIDFNKLAAELAVAFVDRFDPDTLTSGVLKVEPKHSVAKELPKILCFLMQAAETYECLSGNLNEPIQFDRVVINGRVFKNIKAHLIKMKDGSIQVRKMDLVFEDADKIDIDIEMTGISISYQLPEKSQLYKASLLSAAPMMRPADLARNLFNTFIPEHIDFNIDQISGEFHSNVLDGSGEDTVGFGLSRLKFSLNLHKYYPKPYMDISVGPQDRDKTIESIKVNVAGRGVVDYVEADINVDRHRNGYADVTALLEPARLHRFAGWLAGGPVKVNAKFSINNAIGRLDDIESIRVNAARFGWIYNALLKNTVKANNPGFTLLNDGKAVIKLKLSLFCEERSNPMRWLAKAANRFLQFFTRPIEIPLSFSGAPYEPASKGEKGLGSFNIIRFIDGLFNPCPLSMHSDTHEALLRKLGEISIDEHPQEHLDRLDNIIDQVIAEFRMGNAPSDLTLIREIPLESLHLLVNRVKSNEGGQNDLSRLLFLVAHLVEALPEKAVQLVNRSGYTPESGGQPYLLHLIATTPNTSWLTNPENGKVMEPVYQNHQFKRLQEFWKNSQSNPDGSIYNPDSEKEPAQRFTEKVVEKVRTLARELNIPDDIKLMMARDFDFANKMFGIEAAKKQGLPVNSPANQLPYHSQGLPPVKRVKDIGRATA
ncbi:hypothetical protein [Endozoicomonas sp. SCSIO W0465]|uniref:hypothetical protein n=1 Tax=Endozoicomonas sp. SCSIO W0465 TaxID=2918516 RepID=UPI00207656BC|nr:hypothetical protein [Endozoicomonas sp. SCSIO W0465]USE38212.1 hypothetical protein MJO57_08630 [Endozoicomonas sp. SCSIO W0465]